MAISKEEIFNTKASKKNIEKIETLNKEFILNAKRLEKVFTPTLQKIANEEAVSLYGLDFNVKSESSLLRKVKSIAVENQDYKNVEKTFDEIFDANRYTMILDEDYFGICFDNIVSKLSKQGYELIRCNNTFNKEDASYKGVNCNFKDKDGNIFELQFHTETSIEFKENKCHKIYEKMRQYESDTYEYKENLNRLKELNESIKTPTYMELIRNFNDIKGQYDEKKLLAIYKKNGLISEEEIKNKNMNEIVRTVDNKIFGKSSVDFESWEYLNKIAKAFIKSENITDDPIKETKAEKKILKYISMHNQAVQQANSYFLERLEY